VAVDVAGLRYDEAAKLLDVTVSTLGTRLYRARARLADALS
jgi:DNA-directed RNA polymerase specialized sigma24 family protein